MSHKRKFKRQPQHTYSKATRPNPIVEGLPLYVGQVSVLLVDDATGDTHLTGLDAESLAAARALGWDVDSLPVMP